jgi:hypothetical protein
MNKYQIPDWDKLEWNAGADWAIPLPEFPVDRAFIQGRWFVPDEAPLIPTGWIYRLAEGEVRSEYRLWCRQQSLQFTESRIERVTY